MKFTVVIHDREGYSGGPVINMRRLLPRLAARGHSVQVLGLATGRTPNLGWLARQPNVIVELIPPYVRSTHHAVRWIMRCLQLDRPDVFVPNSFLSGFIAARWAREAGIPSLGFFRSDDPFYWAMVDLFVFGDSKWALSGVASVSATLLDRLLSSAENVNDVRFSFIPSGVPIPDSHVDQHSGVFSVCYVGRLEQEQKRIRETAEVLFRCVEVGTCQRVGFIGKGSEEAWLREQIATRNLTPHVTLHGNVAPETLPQVLTNYHACVLLSDYEGTPGALMDAMAAGLVPVTTRLPDGTSELVKDGITGLQCSDRFETADACLERISGDKHLRQHLADNAREHIGRHYSIETTVDRFELFASQLLRLQNKQSRIKVPLRIEIPEIPSPLRREFSPHFGRLDLARGIVRDAATNVLRLGKRAGTLDA